MYFNALAQAKILVRFHFALNKNGFLFLGKAEMLYTRGNLFTPIALKPRIFTKVPDRRTIILKDVERSTLSRTSYLDVQVALMLDTSSSVLGVSLTCTDVSDRKQLTEELESSNEQLEMVSEELDCTKEELETINQAFPSTVY